MVPDDNLVLRCFTDKRHLNNVLMLRVRGQLSLFLCFHVLRKSLKFKRFRCFMYRKVLKVSMFHAQQASITTIIRRSYVIVQYTILQVHGKTYSHSR